MKLLELVIECLHDLLAGQDGGAEMESSILLAKAGAGHSGDASGLQEPQAVVHVRGLAQRLGLCLRLLGQEDLRRAIIRGWILIG